VDVPDVSYPRTFLANIYTLWQAPNFEPIARRLATGRRLVLVNPRGVGLSDRPRGFGLAVNVGARVSAAAGTGEILVSGTVKDLVAGSGLAFDDRGEHELKGVPDRRRLYAVRS
jgi:class 3 adenylate cyclase